MSTPPPRPPGRRQAAFAWAWRIASILTAAAAPPPPVPTLLPVPPATVNHAPGLVELPSGALLLCWYSGNAEAARDVSILCAVSRDRGAGWSAPTTAVGPGDQAEGAREANKSLGNVVLHLEGSRVWMIHGVIQRWQVPPFGNLCLNWYCGRVDARFSDDGGRHWSGAVRLDDQPGALPRAPLLRHPTLGLLLPLYNEGAGQSYVRQLAFDGTAIRAGPAIALDAHGLIQPALVLVPDGTVRAFLRDGRARAVHTAVLDPATLRWSMAVPTSLANPDSAVAAFRDDGDRFVVIHNPSTTARAALTLASSRDGTHFTPGCNLVPAGTAGEVAYPTAIRARDGLWHVAYSAGGKRRIAHLAFDATWLSACLGPVE